MIPAPDQIGVDITYDDPPTHTYTHPEVLAAIARGEKWADPCMDPALIADWPARQAAAAIPFEVVDGRPLNPSAPTGIRYGRNQLGHWGEQLCADAIVTAFTEDGRWLAMVERGDGYGWALPGGTADPGETPEVAALRELREETGLRLGGVPWYVLPARYVPDPRASDEAWMVTVPVRTHLGTMPRGYLPTVVGADDARRAEWVRADSFTVLVRHLAKTYQGQVFAAHEPMLSELLGPAARMTATNTLTSTVDAIVDRLDNRDLPGARRLFDEAVNGDQEAVEPLVRQLAATVVRPAGMLVWGFGLDIWANPYRDPDERAWRCGDCPWTASHYKSDRAAQASARKHVDEHHASRPPKVVSYLDEAYWQAVEAAEAEPAKQRKL